MIKGQVLTQLLEINKTQQDLITQMLKSGGSSKDRTNLADLITPFGSPDPTTLDLMNEFRPVGSQAYERDEIVSVPLMASNNLLWRSNGIWSPNALMTLAALFQRDAADGHRDHWWSSTDKVYGFVYSSQLFISSEAPDDMLGRGNVMKGYLTDPDTRAIDQEIVNRDGYIQLVLHVAVQSSLPVVDAFRFRRIGDVSIGCLTDGKYICPIDGTYFGSKSYMRCEHGHYMPHWLVRYFVDDEEQNMIAPYYIRDGVTDAIEVSSVIAGDVPAANVVRQG